MGNPATDDKITRKDLLDLEDRLTKKLATKEELKQEVAKLATKEELNQATAKLATREAVDVLANQVLKNTNDIDEIKKEIKAINYKIDRLDEKFDSKFNLVLNAVDNVLKEITNNRTERAAYEHALKRHDMLFENHEKRIQKLERRVV